MSEKSANTVKIFFSISQFFSDYGMSEKYANTIKSSEKSIFLKKIFLFEFLGYGRFENSAKTEKNHFSIFHFFFGLR